MVPWSPGVPGDLAALRLVKNESLNKMLIKLTQLGGFLCDFKEIWNIHFFDLDLYTKKILLKSYENSRSYINSRGVALPKKVRK